MTLRIAINAQMLPGTGVGGTYGVLTGLIRALSCLDGPERYVIVGPWEHSEWLRPYMGSNQSLIRGPKTQAVKRLFMPVKPMVRTIRRVSSWMSGNGKSWPRLAQSNGFYEGLDCAVVHFPYQQFIISTLPAVFNPHDLQHVHYPEFFSAQDFEWREATYSSACQTARTVVVHSEWVKRDVVEHYKIDAQKVRVILSPPPTQIYNEPSAEDLNAVAAKYNLSRNFALYPAMTWEHKNHIRLLEALALLRERWRLKIQLICTGHQSSFFSVIERQMTGLQLQDQVRFLGMIPAEHLRAIYRLALFTVLPSLFEGGGLPLVEAWNEGSPVASANATSLAEHAGEAALLFDPLSVESIADAIHKMTTDATLREKLSQKGRLQLRKFSWETTAKTYRAVYKQAANCTLTEEDRSLLHGN